MSDQVSDSPVPDQGSQEIRLAILQRVVNPYRRGLFQEIGRRTGIELRVFHGEDVPDSKVRNAKDISGFEHQELPTRFLKIGKMTLAWHRGLDQALNEFQPDVILCEGESNLLAYLVALKYRFFNRRTALVLWSLVWLIGKPLSSNPLAYLYRRIVHGWFDAFVAYSSFSKEIWVRMGMDPKRIVVAANVADTTGHVKVADREAISAPEARQKIGIPESFTILYSGTLDSVKKPGLLLKIAELFQGEDVNFVFLGRGPLLNEIRDRARSLGLTRVFIPGFVEPDQVSLFYFASDLLVVPGRGGMVISEAMAYGLPVLVHQADGTEVDLVENNETGYCLEEASAEAFAQKIRLLMQDSPLRSRLGNESRLRVRNRFTTSATADCILEAVYLGRAYRNQSGRA